MMKRFGMAAAASAAILLSGCTTLTGGQLVSGDAPVGQIVVVNNSGNPINALTISKCSAMSHGLSRLDGSLSPGRSMTWRVDQGCWDVQAGFGYGDGYDLASFSDLQVRGGRTLQLTVNGVRGGPVREY